MMRMRKVLIIRTPFCFLNKTLYDYSLKIVERGGKVKEIITLQPEKSYPVDFNLYKGYDIQIKFKTKISIINGFNAEEFERDYSEGESI